jgi:hypothetical protein
MKIVRARVGEQPRQISDALKFDVLARSRWLEEVLHRQIRVSVSDIVRG